MTIKDHIFVSPVAGGICFFVTTDWMLSGLAIVASVLIDVDHVFDQVIEKRRLISLFQMIKNYESRKVKKIYLFLHSIEILLLLLIVTGPDSLVGAVIIGFLFHISCDIYEWVWKRRIVSPFSYFIVYRLYHSFDLDKLLTPIARAKIAK